MRNLSFLFVAMFLLQLTTFPQTKWFKYVGNPVIEKGAPGEWDALSVVVHGVIRVQDTLKLWYMASASGFDYRIGYAWSVDGGITWTKHPDPVLTPTQAWEINSVLAPNVIFTGSEYKMWYAAAFGWGTARIGYAWSDDGITWTKYQGNPVLIPDPYPSWDRIIVSRPNVIGPDSMGVLKMWYHGDDGTNLRIGYAWSTDGGITWTKHPNPVLDIGPTGSWDDRNVGHPTVLYNGQSYQMWYNGSRDNAFLNSSSQIGYATSPNETTWTKVAMPVVRRGPGSWDNAAVFPGNVLFDGNIYRMLYTGDDGTEMRIGYAEDFSNLVHADSVILEERYVKPNTDTLNILGRVISPEVHALTAKAIILSDDGSTQDSVELLDDGLHGDGDSGDGIYGGFLTVADENIYTVGIKTIDQETGFTRNGLNWNITDRFTTAGPVVLDSIAWSYNSLFNFYKIEPYIRNDGNDFTINNPLVSLISDDPWITSISGPKTYPSLPPGAVTTGTKFTVKVDSTFPGYFNFKTWIGVDGWYYWVDSTSFIVTSVKEEEKFPISYKLFQNYPNPFNPSTSIEFSVPVNSNVTLTIYNSLGQVVTTLVNEEISASSYSVIWNGTDKNGLQVSSGVYLYKMQANGNNSNSETKKMILLK